MPSFAELRPATPADRDAVEEVLAASYGTLLRPAYDDVDLAAALPFLTRARPELLACGTFFVAELDGIVVGCGGWTRAAPGADEVVDGEAHIRHVACDPAWARHGVGRAILGRCLTDAKAGGIRLLHCQSTRTAVPFYRSLGFSAIAETPLDLPSGPFPMVVMEARLAA